MGVPGLFIVSRYIGGVMVSFSDIYKSIVKTQSAPFEVGCGAAGMPRDIGYLSAVGYFHRVCKILRLLVGVVAGNSKEDIVRQVERRGGAQVTASNLDIAVVHHLPAVLAVALWDSDDLILDLIEIAVRLNSKGMHYPIRPSLIVLNTAIVLSRKFGFEGYIADIGIVEVVEGGHAEDALVKGPQEEFLAQDRLVGEKNSRRQLRALFGGRRQGTGRLMDLIKDKRA